MSVVKESVSLISYRCSKRCSPPLTHEQSDALSDLDLVITLDAAPGEIERRLHRDPALG